MYATHRSMVIHSCAKYGMTLPKHKIAVAQTRSHVKFDLEVGQRCIGIMTVRNTSSQSDRPMYRI